MSLESKIETLTIAIIELTETIKGQKPKSEKEEIKIEKSKKEENLSHQDLQDLCSSIVREDRSKKQNIMDLLESYGAKTISKIPEDKIQEVGTKLKGLL
jgi:hypothetical protein